LRSYLEARAILSSSFFFLIAKLFESFEAARIISSANASSVVFLFLKLASLAP